MGRGIRNGVELEEMHITQVAAVVAELLDMSLETEAKVPEGMLEF